MEDFKQLKASLRLKIKEAREKIKELENVKKTYEKEKTLIENAFDNDNNQISNKKKKEIISLYPFTEELFTLLNRIKNIYDLVERCNYKSIDIDELTEILRLSKYPIMEQTSVIEEVKAYQRLFNKIDGSTPSSYTAIRRISNEYDGLKSFFNDLYEYNFNRIQSAIEKSFEMKYEELNDYEEKLELLNRQIEQLQKFDIFDEEGNFVRFFEDKRELEMFYLWMLNNIDVEEQLRLIPLITKEGMHALKQEKEIDETIDSNREELIRDITGESQIGDISINLELFDDKEKETIETGLKIYNELCGKVYERDDLLESNDDPDKEQYYMMSGVYNWDVILYDIEQNVLPHIEDQKENTLNTFKLLIDLYNRFKNEKRQRKDILDIIYYQIDAYEELIRFGDKYDTSKYDYVFEENLKEDDERYPKGVSRSQIDMSYYLNHIVKKAKEELEAIRDEIEEKIKERKIIEDNDGIDIDSIKKRFGDDESGIYHEASVRVDEFKKHRKEELESQGIEVPAEISSNTKNLVFILFDVSDETVEKYSSVYAKAFDMISKRKRSDLTDAQLSELYKEKKKNKHGISYSIPHVSVLRLRPNFDNRIGVIKLNPSSKILEFLREKYGLSEQFEIYGLLDIIEKHGNLDAYSDLTVQVNQNIGEITRIGEMFYSDKTDMEELCEIIDRGIEKLETMTNSEVNKHD